MDLRKYNNLESAKQKAQVASKEDLPDEPLYVIESAGAYYVDTSDFTRNHETIHAKYLKGKSVKI